MKISSFNLKKFLVTLIIPTIVFLLLNSIVIIPEEYIGIIKRNNQILDKYLSSGIHLIIPFIDDVSCLNNTNHEYRDIAVILDKNLELAELNIKIYYNLNDEKLLKYYKVYNSTSLHSIISNKLSKCCQAVMYHYSIYEITDKKYEIEAMILEQIYNEINYSDIQLENVDISINKVYEKVD